MSKDERKEFIEDIKSELVVDSTNFSADEYMATFSSQFKRLLSRMPKNEYNNPIYTNAILKDTNGRPLRLNSTELERMLRTPEDFEDEMAGLSQFLYHNVPQYFRAGYHLADILAFNYELLPTKRMPTSSREISKYKASKRKANEFLRKFDPKSQCQQVMIPLVFEGGGYYYLRETETSIDLLYMPREYCYIVDKTEVGWSYEFDLTFFYRYPGAFSFFPEEFGLWYQQLAKAIEEQPTNRIYVPMPKENGIVFKFNDSSPEILPVLTGTFKDALHIQDYKDLLKTRIELDTWQIVMQEVPKDSDGKPTIDAETVALFTALVQSQLPNGVKTASTALKPSTISFNQAQTQNTIIGTGEQNFWSGVGIAGNQFGDGDKSGMAITASNRTDYAMMRTVYSQFERFINYQLSLFSDDYAFKIKFFGSDLFEEEEQEMAIKLAQNGGTKQRMFASYGYEPYELEAMLVDEMESGLNDLMIPLKTSHTMGGEEGGAPSKKGSQLGASGINMRDGDYNNG